MLIVFLGTVAFLLLRPEGEFTPADPSVEVTPESITLLTWNVLMARETQYESDPWEKRKKAFQEALKGKEFDLICLQEALPNQVEFFSQVFSTHEYYGVGRDDGKGSGEHCPIYYRRDRFIKQASGTFWLSPTPETPSYGWGEIALRICSWVELEDKKTGERFRVYNAHLPLHPLAQKPATELITSRFKESKVPVIMAGDMNCPPGWPALKPFEESGLRGAETSGALTFQILGEAVRSLDHIFIDPSWAVPKGGIIRGEHDGVSPSDHFGVWAVCVPKK